MTAIIEVLLICDGEACAEGEPFGVDVKRSTAREQRAAAAYSGWVYSQGKDYCPECALKLKSRARKSKNEL